MHSERCGAPPGEAPHRERAKPSLPAFYNGVMRARRVPHERARWLSAVLIVAAIAAVSVVLRRPPVAAGAPPPVAASHPYHTFIVPALRPRPVPGVHADPVAALHRGPRQGPAIEAVTGGGTGNPGVVPVPAAAPASPAIVTARPADVAPSGPAAAVLPARGFELLLAGTAMPPSPRPWRGVPPRAADDRPAAALTGGGGSPRRVAKPALAMARAVSVAGRGIRTGLRATTAAFRAAF